MLIRWSEAEILEPCVRGEPLGGVYLNIGSVVIIFERTGRNV